MIFLKCSKNILSDRNALKIRKIVVYAAFLKKNKQKTLKRQKQVPKYESILFPIFFLKKVIFGYLSWQLSRIK